MSHSIKLNVPSLFSLASSDISVQITTSGSSVLGESGFTLTCYVSGADHLNPFITYQWTKQFDGTQTQIQDGPDPRTISFTPLSISDVGCYTCQATISSFDLNINLVRSGSQDVTVTSESLILAEVFSPISSYLLSVAKIVSTDFPLIHW